MDPGNADSPWPRCRRGAIPEPPSGRGGARDLQSTYVTGMRPWVAVIFCAARPLFGGEPLLDVEGHELRDEFLGRRRDVLPGRFVEFVLGSLDLGLDDALAISRVPEGRITRQQDVEDDAAGPFARCSRTAPLEPAPQALPMTCAATV